MSIDEMSPTGSNNGKATFRGDPMTLAALALARLAAAFDARPSGAV
ncbi:MAG TPA: hypothetical protein VIT01_00380 [Acidimicrobiales bacterium]